MKNYYPGHLGRGNKIHFLYGKGNSAANCNNSVRTRGRSFGEPIAAENVEDLLNKIVETFGPRPLEYICEKCLNIAQTTQHHLY
jgi:hypothetical protein